MVGYVHIEYSTYQFSKESTVPKKCGPEKVKKQAVIFPQDPRVAPVDP